jgi:ribosome-associated toxin RatA of RatAB toxin-antitoxin module
MDTHIERLVRAEPQTVFDLAAQVEDWPRILPHYRWVRVLEVAADGRRTVEMAARRDVVGRLGVPLRWVAVQSLEPPHRVGFEHIGGPTRGMLVAWTLEATSDARTRVRIRHVFEPRWPVPESVVRLIVGEYFVNGVARRTLARVAELAEASPRLPRERRAP